MAISFEAICETDPQRRTYAQVIAEALALRAVKGDVAAASELCDHIEGRPRQALTVTRKEAEIDAYESSDASLDAELRCLSPETVRQVARALLSDDLEGFTREAWSRIGEQSPFIPARYWSALCEYLFAVPVVKIRRLIINLPPRHGQSTLLSVLWPCWQWARDGARSKWLFCSHACDLGLRDSVRRRNLLQSAWCQTFWHDSVQLSADQNQKQEYASTHGGAMFSTWVGGATGRGADHIVIDDPHALTEAYSRVELENTVNYLRQTIFSRLDRPARQRQHCFDHAKAARERSDGRTIEPFA